MDALWRRYASIAMLWKNPVCINGDRSRYVLALGILGAKHGRIFSL
jgi:hypothetical protein